MINVEHTHNNQNLSTNLNVAYKGVQCIHIAPAFHNQLVMEFGLNYGLNTYSIYCIISTLKYWWTKCCIYLVTSL